MSTLQEFTKKLQHVLGEKLQKSQVQYNEVTLDIDVKDIHEVCQILHDHEQFYFDQLMDVCGVDYLHYGLDEWTTDSATSTGFERGVENTNKTATWDHPRFAVVYHLLSVKLNHRVRLRVFLTENDLKIPSVTDIWDSANWFEREAFDMYGILFINHPDLRRILTDYGFIGHPFRKDFPISGNVEMRYDATQQRVIYQPVSIQPRILVPKTIRDDSRYIHNEENHG